MKTKKKVLVVALAISLIALAVGGTLAWFTDNESVTNTFVIGEIDIVQHEEEYNDETGALQTFTQQQVLLPVVNTTNVAEDENYVEKLVSVENIGANDAYVRTFIAVPATLKDIIHLDTVADSADGWTKDTIQWPNVEVDGVEYAVISFTYNTALVKDAKTDYLLNGVYMDAAVDMQKDSTGNKQFCTEDANGDYVFYSYDITKQIQVLVATQGCQADGFTSGAVNALNTVFGTTEVPNFTAQ